MLVSVTQLALDLPVAARVGVMGRQMRDKGTSWVDVLTDLGGAGRRQHVDDDAGTIVVHVFDRDRHLTVSTNTTRLIIIIIIIIIFQPVAIETLGPLNASA